MARTTGRVQPWGGTTWWVLGRSMSALRVEPGATLVDVGCGRGKPGLWLSRETGAALIGVDWSPVAVASAARLSVQFVQAASAVPRRRLGRNWFGR